MKILYVATISRTVHAFLIPHIEMLVQKGHKVDIACNMVTPEDDRLVRIGCRYFSLDFQRSPLNKKNITAYQKLKKLIVEERYDLVHTHTPVASACVRLACKSLETVKVFYTAHGFHFFKGAPFPNWLYYPIEWFLSRYTDLLITINKEDYIRACRSLKAKNVVCVHGVGINIDRVNNVRIDKKVKRTALGIPEEDFVILSVGELNENKNHSTVIRSVAQIKNRNITYIICGRGGLEARLTKLTAHYGLTDKVKLLGYRTDVLEMYRIADVYVHPSFREGLPVSLMEAMAAGLPCVVSDTRGNTDLLEDGKGGYVLKPDDIKGFASAIEKVASDKQSSENMGSHNKIAVKRFNIASVLTELSRLYEAFC